MRVGKRQRICSGFTLTTGANLACGVITGCLGACGIAVRVWSPATAGGGTGATNPGLVPRLMVGPAAPFATSLTAAQDNGPASPVLDGRTKATAHTYHITPLSGGQFAVPCIGVELTQGVTQATKGIVVDAWPFFGDGHLVTGGIDQVTGLFLEGDNEMPVMMPQSGLLHVAKGDFGNLNTADGARKYMLLSDAYVPNPDHEFVADIVAAEISGVTGYTGGFNGAGRIAVGACTLTADNTNDQTVLQPNALTGVWTLNKATAVNVKYVAVVKEITNDAASIILSIARITPQWVITNTATQLTFTPDADGIAKFPSVKIPS